jgi:hypothetical protein
VSLFAVIMCKQWPLHAPVLNYCEFRYLQHLKFILPCFNSNLLVNVLKKCRMLQVLIIQSNMVCLLPKFNSINLWSVYVYISLYSTHKYMSFSTILWQNYVISYRQCIQKKLWFIFSLKKMVNWDLNYVLN